MYQEIDGERIPRDVAEALIFMVIGGGVDTTTALTSAALLHLHQFPDDRARLLHEPDLLDSATEEFLRVYPPARTHARTATEDFEFVGCPIRKGDRVLLSEVSAGHDGRAFPDADQFQIDRFPNRHLAFGAGIHRCPGSHLARITFTEIIREVLERIPDYRRDRRRGRRVPQLVDDRGLGQDARPCSPPVREWEGDDARARRRRQMHRTHALRVVRT